MILSSLKTLRHRNILSFPLYKNKPSSIYNLMFPFFIYFSFLHSLSFMHCYFILLLITVFVDPAKKYCVFTCKLKCTLKHSNPSMSLRLLLTQHRCTLARSEFFLSEYIEQGWYIETFSLQCIQ